MPRGLQSKLNSLCERIPDEVFFYYCNGKLIKKAHNKKTYDMFVRLHIKKCDHCQKYVKETGSSPTLIQGEFRENKYGKYNVINTILKI
jgi:hypothetical protein